MTTELELEFEDLIVLRFALENLSVTTLPLTKDMKESGCVRLTVKQLKCYERLREAVGKKIYMKFFKYWS